MKSAAAAVLAASALLSTAFAGTVHMQIAKNQQVEAYNLRKRSTVTAALGNALLGYYVNVTVGTPPQSLSLTIDTGSSDVWLPASSASQCTSSKNGGCPGGSFNSAKSSTFKDVGQGQFNISYVDTSSSTGDYFQDTFSIGSATLSGFQMGLALDTDITHGIAGIAYSSNEAILGTAKGKSYPNLVESMVTAGLIPTMAYSLWLDDLEASTGSLLFGGIDTTRYTGPLTSIKVYPTYASYITYFTVAFTGLSVTSPTGTDTLTPSNYSEAALLDSGTSLTYLPNDIAQAVFLELGATYDSSAEETIVPCNLRNVNGTLNFSLGGPGAAIVKVPIREMVLSIPLNDNDSPVTYPNGNTACLFGIQPALDGNVLLGDTFLRSAYVVYDLANNRIAVAQTNFNPVGKNVVQFASKGAAIPSATKAPSEPTVIQTASAVIESVATPLAQITGIIKPGATGTGLAVPGFAAATTATTAKTATTTTAISTTKSAAGPMPKPGSWGVLAGLTTVVAVMISGGGALILL